MAARTAGVVCSSLPLDTNLACPPIIPLNLAHNGYQGRAPTIGTQYACARAVGDKYPSYGFFHGFVSLPG